LLACGSEPLDPRQADTAVFYSISNCLGGLRGIPFGSFLIKQVIAELQAENLRLRLFATLSPVPGFRTWLNSLSADRREALVADDHLATLGAVEAADWRENLDVWEKARPLLLRLCAHYLLCGRKRDRALDPVAAFHLANGAAVEQINWLADKSEKGLTQSFGLMVNYAYRPRQIEGNHEGYVKRGRIAASAKVRAMLRQPSPVRTARPEGDNESRRQEGASSTYGGQERSSPAVRGETMQWAKKLGCNRAGLAHTVAIRMPKWKFRFA
jgi:malonyl-CoA decarboxylase